MTKPKCPRCGKEPALIDITIGVLPGKKCQADDEKNTLTELPQFANQSKQERVQEQRDKNDGDMLQPYLPGKDAAPNPDFVKAYPQMAGEYFSQEQLKKM